MLRGLGLMNLDYSDGVPGSRHYMSTRFNICFWKGAEHAETTCCRNERVSGRRNGP